MCKTYPCLNRILCKILSVSLFCGCAEGVHSSHHTKTKVLMLMAILCFCGQDGGVSSLSVKKRSANQNDQKATSEDGRKLKFPEPGRYDTAEFFEDVWTSEYGYEGVIFSDGYPYPYIPEDQYQYLLVADEDQIVELTFSDPFDIEYADNCLYDYLLVRDGRYGYSPPLGRLCGNQVPDPILSSGRYMSLLFVTDADVNGIGFIANYTFKDAPPKKVNSTRPKECHFNVGGTEPRTLSGYDGFLHSETARYFFRKDDPNAAIDCTWEINMPEFYKIMIEFQEFLLADVNECNKNRVEIYDMFTYNLPQRLLRSYCSTTAPTLMTLSNRAYIRFVVANSSTGSNFKVLYTAYRDALCNETVSFPCAEFMCLDYSLQCNGRRNCWNFGYDELDCKQESQDGLLDGKVDSVLGVTMGIILLVTVVTIVMTCRHSCLRTREKAKMMAQRRKAEKQAVTYMMDNKEGGDSHEMTTLGERYNTQYIKLSSGPHNGGYGQRPSLTPTTSSAPPPMGIRAPPLTEYEKIMDGDAAYRDARAGPVSASSPWVYRDSMAQAGQQLRPINDIQIHV